MNVGMRTNVCLGVYLKLRKSVRGKTLDYVRKYKISVNKSLDDKVLFSFQNSPTCCLIFNCDSFIIITLCWDSCNTARNNSILVWGIYVPCSKGKLLYANEWIN